jgi:hypothetical protein
MSINFEEIYNVMFNYFHDNLYISIGLAVLLLYLLYRKPKLFFTILLVTSVLAAALYVISHISSAGIETKENMIDLNTITK